MSDDLIKRSDAIRAIDEWIQCGTDRDDDIVISEFLSFLKGDINAIPSADRPQEWIPCSERLPSEDEQDPELGVIITLGNGYSGLQYDWYHNGYWYDWDGYVVAWMPLPEPWKGADDE